MAGRNYSTSMYSGKTENETYSFLTTSSVSGSYYDHIKEQTASWLEKIIQRQDQNGQIVIADYGTADGVGFLSLMNGLLDKHLRIMNGTDFVIYLCDQPSNDFNLLIKATTGTAMSNLKFGPPLPENVSVAVIGRSMYEKCLPKNTLDICFSTTAVHWLSKKPCNITNGLTYKQANKKEEKAFQEQAKRDWRQFLVNRGKELKKGGLCAILCLSNFPQDDGETNLHVLMSDIWERLVDSRIITQEEFVNTTLEDYMRKSEDFSYPFVHHDQDIVTLGLQLLSNNPIKHKFTRMIKQYSEIDEEDRKMYADTVVEYIKPWLRNTIYYGLSARRSVVSRNEICDAYFQILWEMAYRREIKISYLCFQRIIIQKKIRSVKGIRHQLNDCTWTVCICFFNLKMQIIDCKANKRLFLF